MWLWRGIEKISWRDRVSHQDVLIKVDEKSCLMRTIWQKKEELDRSCAQREWTIEGRVGGKNVGKEKERQTKNENARGSYGKTKAEKEDTRRRGVLVFLFSIFF